MDSRLKSSAGEGAQRTFMAGQGGLDNNYQARTFAGTPIAQAVPEEHSNHLRLRGELANAQRALGNLPAGSAAHTALRSTVLRGGSHKRPASPLTSTGSPF